MRSSIRAFIAIRLTSDIQKGLDEIILQLKGELRGAPIRWVPVENIHLTLKFLGDVASDDLETLKQALVTEAKRYSPFETGVGELGVFPSLRKPRVLWVGVQAPQQLIELQHRIETSMARLGYPREERGFTPHLTLGRISRDISESEVKRIAAVIENSKVQLGSMPVQAIDLYRSDLHPSGAIYTCLFTAPLKVTPET